MIFQLTFIKGIYCAWLLAITIITTFNLQNNLVKWALIPPSIDEKPKVQNSFLFTPMPHMVRFHTVYHMIMHSYFGF